MSAVFEGLPVKSVSIDNMLRQRDAALERIGVALNLLTEAREISAAAGLGFPRFRLETNKYQIYSMLDPDQRADTDRNIALEVDSGGWQHLMNESGMRSLMDAKARHEWDESIHKGKVPDFNRENVTSTFQELHGSRGEIFERGVLAVFKRLSWCYKTNQPFAFGKRIWVTYLRGSMSGPGNSLGYVNHDHTDELDDLVRVLSILDGKPEPDHRNGMYSAINQVKDLSNRDVDTEYLHVRCFRNGNGRITFKRPDLVTKMNQILTKHFPGALAHNHHVETT